MLVYGDGTRLEAVWEKLPEIARGIEAAWRGPAGLARHAELVAVFIAAGELAQGLSDAAFAVRKADARSAPGEAAMRLLIALARGIERSWSSGFRELGEQPTRMLEALSAAGLPEALEISRPEGYAFYALYPEGYIQAARPYSGMPLTIVGLRSIGTGVAAAVAAGAGQEDAITVRPVGHPFRRELALSEDLAAELKSGSTFAIVDEGPGLSGSSLGCVADFLEDGGIAPRRIHFFPSHAGSLGPQASARHRARWARARRPVVGFEALALNAADPRHRIESWVADLCGAPTAPTIELSGGEWRRLRFASEAQWPPANPQQERRKFLLRCEDGPWLLRFAGLGRYGSDKLDLARELASAGFVPPVAGFRHGFTVEPWLEHARPLGAVPQDRSGLVEHLGRYIGTRARLFPADCPGASLEQLAAMARRNCELALGDAAARALRHLDEPAAPARPPCPPGPHRQPPAPMGMARCRRAADQDGCARSSRRPRPRRLPGRRLGLGRSRDRVRARRERERAPLHDRGAGNRPGGRPRASRFPRPLLRGLPAWLLQPRRRRPCR